MKGPPAPPVKYTTLNEALAAAAQTGIALSFVDAREVETSLPYFELCDHARRMAAGLAEKGVRPGDRVALVLPTSPAFVESFFGTLLAGAIPVPLYPPMRLGRLDEYHRRTAAMLTAAGVSLVVADERVRRLLGSSVDAAGPRLGCVYAASLMGSGTFEHRAAGGDIALIQFSSGTTVDAKPVALTHANLLANLAAIDTFISEDGTANATGVTWLPLYHDMGLIGCLLEAVYRPGPLTLIPPELFLARPAVWLRALSRHRATISPAPNFAYGLCLKRIRDDELDGVDLSAWSLALNGAEPVVPAVLRRFAERFARWGFRSSALTPVYGLSEAALAVTFTPLGSSYRVSHVDAEALATERIVRDGTREVVSVGPPLAGVEIEVRSDSGEPLAPENAGRIFVRGPSVMAGYFERPELTAAVLRDGWLDTGDVGFEKDGELYISGRAKELIILRGANHAPHEFEEALDGVAGVRAGCAVAVSFMPEDATGEELALLVETEGDFHPTLAEVIRGRVAEHTGIRPAAVELLAPGTLPRTSSGKLRRTEAARLWVAGRLQPPKRVTTLGMVLELAKGELLHARAAFKRPALEAKAKDT
jgi:fatty-acyl-CoA synthase